MLTIAHEGMIRRQCAPVMEQCDLMWSFLAMHTHTHLFNGPLSGTTRVSRYQKGETNLDFTEARDSEWQ